MDCVTIPRQAGGVIRKARQEKSLTQEELAERAGVSTRLISSIELGDNPGIQLNKLISILCALDLSLYIGNAEDIEPPKTKHPGVVVPPTQQAYYTWKPGSTPGAGLNPEGLIGLDEYKRAFEERYGTSTNESELGEHDGSSNP